MFIPCFYDGLQEVIDIDRDIKNKDVLGATKSFY